MLNISFVCYLIVALFSLIFGVIYLTRSQFMPYHEIALSKNWEELEETLQTLLLALMRIAGGGLLATGLIICLLIYSYFITQEKILLIILPFPCLITSFASIKATLIVTKKTPAKPPLKLSVFCLILIFIAIFNSIIFVV
jgi:hypothetical protein